MTQVYLLLESSGFGSGTLRGAFASEDELRLAAEAVPNTRRTFLEMQVCPVGAVLEPSTAARQIVRDMDGGFPFRGKK